MIHNTKQQTICSKSIVAGRSVTIRETTFSSLKICSTRMKYTSSIAFLMLRSLSTNSEQKVCQSYGLTGEDTQMMVCMEQLIDSMDLKVSQVKRIHAMSTVKIQHHTIQWQNLHLRTMTSFPGWSSPIICRSSQTMMKKGERSYSQC